MGFDLDGTVVTSFLAPNMWNTEVFLDVIAGY